MEKKEIECIDCGPGIDVETLTDRLVLKERIVIIPGLEGILVEVIKMRLPTRAKVGDEIMRRVKLSHEVPAGEEKYYRAALMDEYDQRTIDFI